MRYETYVISARDSRHKYTRQGVKPQLLSSATLAGPPWHTPEMAAEAGCICITFYAPSESCPLTSGGMAWATHAALPGRPGPVRASTERDPHGRRRRQVAYPPYRAASTSAGCRSLAPRARRTPRGPPPAVATVPRFRASRCRATTAASMRSKAAVLCDQGKGSGGWHRQNILPRMSVDLPAPAGAVPGTAGL